VRKTIAVEVPADFEIDEEAVEWIEHIIERAGRRGSGLEDAEAAVMQISNRKAETDGVKRAVRFVRDLSGKAYAEGDDTKARTLRSVSDSLAPLVAEMEKATAEYEDLFMTRYQQEVRERRKAKL